MNAILPLASVPAQRHPREQERHSHPPEASESFERLLADLQPHSDRLPPASPSKGLGELNLVHDTIRFGLSTNGPIAFQPAQLRPGTPGNLSPVTEDVRAERASPPELPPEPAVGAQQRAEIFNEHGFLQTSPAGINHGRCDAAGGHQAVPDYGHPFETCESPHGKWTDGFPRSPGDPPFLPPARRAGRTSVAALNEAQLSGCRVSSPDRTSTSIAIHYADGRLTSSGKAEDEAVETGNKAPREQIMRRMGRANGGKALDVSLLLRSGGEGLQVIAHVSRLPDAQRARIREEVVRMLASHGFAPHHVILNGEAHPFALSHNEALECR